jgi:hypothetical protein
MPAEELGPQLDQFEGGEGQDGGDAAELKEIDEFGDVGDAFYSRAVNRFPKSSIWMFVVIALAAMRAATPFVIVVAFLSLLARGL